MFGFILTLTLILLLPTCLPAQETDAEFPDDELEQRLAEVGGKALVLLQAPPQRPVHHHHNRIQITSSSLNDGWVELEQCHQHLDPVGQLEIVYHPERIRNLRILASANIASSRVIDARVELTEIGQQASICLAAESRALHALGGGRYRLRNGPYMRRFLDGYYPMHVTLEIGYPARLLELADCRPEPGRAGGVRRQPGQVSWDAWFKGELFTEFDFRTVMAP